MFSYIANSRETKSYLDKIDAILVKLRKRGKDGSVFTWQPVKAEEGLISSEGFGRVLMVNHDYPRLSFLPETNDKCSLP